METIYARKRRNKGKYSRKITTKKCSQDNKNILTLQKEKLQQQIASEEEAISSLKEKLKDLDTADQNVDAILQMQIPEPVRSKIKDLER